MNGPFSDLFAPAVLRARARERLLAEPPAPTEARFGDHQLNPDFRPRPDMRFRDAAVLVPIVVRTPQVQLLLTQRTSHLASHAGQIAFPGGKIDPADAGPAGAAIREAGEEIGLDAGLIRPLGYLDAYLTGTGYRVVPVVAEVAADHRLTINPDEVDAVFEVPLAFLMDPANHHLGSREWNGVARHFYEMPFEGRYIWGVTAGIIRAFYERIYA